MKRKTAILITTDNIHAISELNGGLHPPYECLDKPMYFIWAGYDSGVYSLIVSEEVLASKYRIILGIVGMFVVEKI